MEIPDKKELKFVIGANFGDEGKGLMTDYFCHQAVSNGHRTLVILPNGGGQRGHTVCLRDGIRHVFHHMSSGTLVGADTFFTKDFILNPMIFNAERLECDFHCPKMFASMSCRVTTPYDMMYNQVVEKLRGEKKHGSCGAGIYHTMNRYKIQSENNIARSFGDMVNLMHQGRLKKYLEDIRNYYEYKAKMELGQFSSYTDIRYHMKGWDSETLLYHYMDDFSLMATMIHPIYSDGWGTEESEFVRGYDTVVVELGQGLLLDCDNEEYAPNLTPSNTTLFGNATKVNMLLGYPNEYDKEVCYVTRTYLTRHGNGRLDNECKKEDLSDKIEDSTNIPNEHQGSLRFAPLDVKELITRVEDDMFSIGMDADYSIAVTHNDQLPLNDKDKVLLFGAFDKGYISNGQTREDVKLCNEGGV